MEIVYKVGNLLDASERFILHGCNAQGRMGKGVAKAIRDKYPWAFDAYRLRFETDELRLGYLVWALPPDGEPHTIINAITQDRYRKTYEDDQVVYADYDAIRSCIRRVNDIAIVSHQLDAKWLGHPIDAVAMPLLGAGLAGGDWKVISAIIEEETTDFQPVVYTLDGIIPE